MAAGDELVIFTRSNEDFVVAFWAAILGGIVPVPVAVGISDEHRLKLIRILARLKRATLLTEGELLARLEDFAEKGPDQQLRATLSSRAMIQSECTGDGAGERNLAGWNRSIGTNFSIFVAVGNVVERHAGHVQRCG